MLQDFWQEILTVWQTGILNTNLGHIFIALGVFLKNATVPAPERLRVSALRRFDAQTRRQVAP